MPTAIQAVTQPIHRTLLHPHPDNPPERSLPENCAELAESIREYGLLDPLLVRPLPSQAPDVPGSAVESAGFQILLGHRRTVGCKLAGVDKPLCVVREMTDDEARFVMAVDRAHRQDFPPLAEAHAYQLLEAIEGTAEKVAARVKKPVTYVRDRLRLLDLVPDVQRKLAENKLTVDHCLLLARLPEKLQAEAAEAFDRDGNLVSLTDAARLVRARFVLRLDIAPFDRADPDLHPEAGPCTTCMKRTGIQHELFADVPTPDHCLDSECHAIKVDRGWTARAGRAEEKGQRVVEGKETKKLLDSGDYVALDDKVPGDETECTFRQHLGTKNFKKLPSLTLARDEKKGVHELVSYADLRDATWSTERGHALFEQHDRARSEANDAKAQEEKRQAKLAKDRATAIEKAFMGVDAALARLRGDDFVEVETELARLAVMVASKEALFEVARRRLGVLEKGKAELLDLCKGLTRPGAGMSLVAELLLSTAVPVGEDASRTGEPIARLLAALHPAPRVHKAPAEPKAKALPKAEPVEDEMVSVELLTVGSNKIGAVKAIREVTGIGLAEAKGLMEFVPQIVAERVSKTAAEDMKKKFEAVGATVAFKPAPAPVEPKEGAAKGKAKAAQPVPKKASKAPAKGKAAAPKKGGKK